MEQFWYKFGPFWQVIDLKKAQMCGRQTRRGDRSQFEINFGALYLWQNNCTAIAKRDFMNSDCVL